MLNFLIFYISQWKNCVVESIGLFILVLLLIDTILLLLILVFCFTNSFSNNLQDEHYSMELLVLCMYIVNCRYGL